MWIQWLAAMSSDAYGGMRSSLISLQAASINVHPWDIYANEPWKGNLVSIHRCRHLVEIYISSSLYSHCHTSHNIERRKKMWKITLASMPNEWEMWNEQKSTETKLNKLNKSSAKMANKTEEPLIENTIDGKCGSCKRWATKGIPNIVNIKSIKQYYLLNTHAAIQYVMFSFEREKKKLS